MRFDIETWNVGYLRYKQTDAKQTDLVIFACKVTRYSCLVLAFILEVNALI